MKTLGLFNMIDAYIALTDPARISQRLVRISRRRRSKKTSRDLAQPWRRENRILAGKQSFPLLVIPEVDLSLLMLRIRSLLPPYH
jgi:hypothetical protein